MQFGAKSKISSDLLENVYASQLKYGEYESDCFSFSQNLRLILGNFERID